MMRAWPVPSVRAAEAAAMARLPEGELMRRAARGLARVLAARVAPRARQGPVRLAVLAGTGGNGGDALFAGAFLPGELAEAGLAPAESAGVSVVSVLAAGQAHPPAVEAVRSGGGVLIDATAPHELAAALDAVRDADVVVDGLTGIGGRPDLSGDPVTWQLVRAISDDAYVVAVDLPSGTDPEGRSVQANCVFADETVTFSLLKGVHLGAGEQATGLLTVVGIGIEPGPDDVPSMERLTFDDAAARWPVPLPSDDKYSRGVLGVVAGGEKYTGAAVLTVLAAVEAGVGMVRYVGPPGPEALVRAAVPEAVHGAGQVRAWVVGPGIDPAPAADDAAGQAQVAQVRQVLGSGLPCVVDAGALDLLDGPRRGARTLLTPHAGELARLLRRLDPGASPGLRAAEVMARPIRYARRAATLLDATVLLKGHHTYVAPPEPSAPVRSQADAPVWLATAGAGDVLAGIAGALLATGLDPLDAGSVAALVHGVAAGNANPGGPLRARAVAHAIAPAVAALLRRR